MPDFIIKYFYMCSDLDHFQAHVGGYTQEFATWLSYPTCTCPAFKFAKKSDDTWLKCKHLREAAMQLCTWQEQFDEGEVVDGKCPRCGKEVRVVRVAV